MLYIEVGYCSYISLYTLKGRDYLPYLVANKKLFFEGLKNPLQSIFTKRFVALHIRQLFEDSIYAYKLEGY